MNALIVSIEDPPFVPFIFQAIGRATMAWTNIESAGVFKDSLAIECAEAIINFIRNGSLPTWYTD